MKGRWAKVCGYDPESIAPAALLLPEMSFAANAYICVEGADAAAILTEWDDFHALALVKTLLKVPTPSTYATFTIARYSLTYTSVGR